MSNVDFLKELQSKHGNLFPKSEIEIRGGNIEKTDPELLRNLYEERAFHGYPTFLSSVWRDDDGAHGDGKAADKILFKEGAYMRTPVDIVTAYTLMTTWPWFGSGLYLDWRFTSRESGDVVRTPGIHSDISRKGSRPLRWFANTLNSNGETASLKEIMDKNIKTKRYFFYQSVKDGKFYNPQLGRQYSSEGIFRLWEEALLKDKNGGIQ